MIVQSLLATITAVYLKKYIRHVEKDRFVTTSKSQIVMIKANEESWFKRHGAKACMAIHLALIVGISATALGVGYAHRDSTDGVPPCV